MTAPMTAPTVHDSQVAERVARLAAALEVRGWRLATAESCTGGLVAAACTERAGSSVWFEQGVVSYSNAAKTGLLGVPATLIEQHGAVSLPVAQAMARGAQRDAAVQAALSITGVAGPGGGSATKPVGTVCFGWAVGEGCWSERRHIDGDRAAVRRQSVLFALDGLLAALDAPDLPDEQACAGPAASPAAGA
jgi:nicotinamide-nucleotide amidase